jgi:peptidylprolyl isomerase
MLTEKQMKAISRACLFAAATFAAVAGAALVGNQPASAQDESKAMTTATGLKIIDTKVGAGESPKPGQLCKMHYTGWLYVNEAKGKKFDSSLDRGQPFTFTIGRGQVIAGWDEGVESMKVGGKRTLIIPPELGYGARGAGGVIPPNATLIFDVELLDVK